jgi:hypothetical protein
MSRNTLILLRTISDWTEYITNQSVYYYALEDGQPWQKHIVFNIINWLISDVFNRISYYINGINFLCDGIKIYKYLYYLHLIYNVLNYNGVDIKMNSKEIRYDFENLVNLDQVRSSGGPLLILLHVHQPEKTKYMLLSRHQNAGKI